MAAKTQLSQGEADAVLAQFGITGVVTALPDKGTVNSNYSVTSKDGAARYFLRVNEGKRDEDVDAEARIVEHLVVHGVPTPGVIPTTGGSRFALHGGKQVSLFPWLEGKEAVSLVEQPMFAEPLGAALGALHRVGQALTQAELPRDHYSLLSLDARLVRVTDPRLVDVCTAIRHELGAALARDRASLEGGLIHQDLFPDNVLVRGESDLVALLDFEQATFGPLIYDLAVCANAWCWDGAQIRLDLVEQLVRGYELLRPMTVGERSVFIEEAALAAARFTLTRITDIFLRTDVEPDLARRKDYRDFYARLRFWRHL